MADIVKLKKKATDFEAKKAFDKALATYRDVIELYESGEEDPIDIPLYNRVGDLAQKLGNLPEAVSLWERAVDHYTEGGFYNPAIALCNKILRASPGRTVIYYKLGKISAEKGFKGDARENFLEYAGRQQKAGNLDDAFKALKEFADLVPGQHDVRLMLADQLVKAGRKDEAIEQLQLGYQQTEADGDSEAGEKFVSKMKELDPAIEPRSAKAESASSGGGLVFLDVDGGAAAPRAKKPTSEIKRQTKAVEGLELLVPPSEEAPPPRTATPTPSSVPKAAPPAKPPAKPPATAPAKPPATPPEGPPAKSAPAKPAPPPAADLEIIPTDVGGEVAPPSRGSIAGLEVTNLGEEPAAETADTAPESAEPQRAASGDLPLMEIDEPAAPEAAELIDIEPTLAADASDDVSAIEVPLVEMDTAFGGADDASADTPMLIDTGDDSLQLLGETEEEAPAEEIAEEIAEEPVAEAVEEAEEEVEEQPIARSTEIASTVGVLRARVEEEPENWSLHRQLAEALLESGARDDGLAELETSMSGFESAGDLDTAGSIAEEIVRLEPKSIRFHQKRVEFAFRANDRGRLAEAYVELADALLADGQGPKARAVYQRVLDIRPDDLRAQAAIESIPEEEAPAAPAPRRSAHAPKAVAPAKSAAKKDDDEFVSLGDWLREDDEPKSTRMVVEEKAPTGDEAADFNDMLRAFKKGVSDNVDDEDHEAHYDLGVAYKEMGLLDEAIAEFQKALRGTKDRVRTFEALGHCFVEKEQPQVASTILQRALAEPGVRDEALIGVLYVLGSIAEQLGAFQDAKKHFERVFAVDIQFRDIGDRLNAVEQQLQ
jgi:tetratricopeptide (TPR) repeat protein